MGIWPWSSMGRWDDHIIMRYISVGAWWLELLCQTLVGFVSGWCAWRLLDRECLSCREGVLMFGKHREPFSRRMGSTWGWEPGQGPGNWCHVTFLLGWVKHDINVEAISWRPFLWMKMKIREDKLTIEKMRRPRKHKETLARLSKEEFQAKGT